MACKRPSFRCASYVRLQHLPANCSHSSLLLRLLHSSTRAPLNGENHPAKMSSVVIPPAAIVKPLKGMFQTNLPQRSCIKLSTTRQATPLSWNSRTTVRVRDLEGPVNSPMVRYP